MSLFLLFLLSPSSSKRSKKGKLKKKNISLTSVASPIELVSDRPVAAPLPAHGPTVIESPALVEGDPQHQRVVERVGNGLEHRLSHSHHAVLLQESRADVGAAGPELGEPGGLEAGGVGRAGEGEGFVDGDGVFGGDVEERGEFGS